MDQSKQIRDVFKNIENFQETNEDEIFQEYFEKNLI